jgi:hypothetical protein
VPIEDTTLCETKVLAAIAGKDFIGPAKERDAIISHFMKPHGKNRELVFKPGHIEIAVIIDPVDFKAARDKRLCVYELDEEENIIGYKVRTHNLVFIVVTVATGCLTHRINSLRSPVANTSPKGPIQPIGGSHHPMLTT